MSVCTANYRPTVSPHSLDLCVLFTDYFYISQMIIYIWCVQTTDSTESCDGSAGGEMDGNWAQVVFDVQTEKTVIERTLEVFPSVRQYTWLSVLRHFSHIHLSIIITVSEVRPACRMRETQRYSASLQAGWKRTRW